MNEYPFDPAILYETSLLLQIEEVFIFGMLSIRMLYGAESGVRNSSFILGRFAFTGRDDYIKRTPLPTRWHRRFFSLVGNRIPKSLPLIMFLPSNWVIHHASYKCNRAGAYEDDKNVFWQKRDHRSQCGDFTVNLNAGARGSGNSLRYAFG